MQIQRLEKGNPMDVYTILKTRLEHINNKRLSREAFQAKQLGKFRQFVHDVQQHSPYYADLIHKHRITPQTCHPKDFPILTKREVMANFDAIVTDRAITKKSVAQFCNQSQNHLDLFNDQYCALHTSGSSGEVGYFVHSKIDMVRGITSLLRINPRVKLRKKQFSIAYVGALGGHFTAPTMISAHQHTFLKKAFPIEMIDINDPLDTIVAKLNAWQPDLLMSYGSMLARLSEQQLRGDLNIHPFIIRNGAEPLTTQTQTLVQQAFGINVQNIYASTEHLVMGFALPEYHGMYLMEDVLYFEFESDHTLVTNLANYTQPLIRYRMEDVLEPIEDPNPIYPFTKIKNVVGRVEHTPIFINQYGREDFISPMFLTDIAIENLRRYQFQLIDNTSFVFKLEPVLGLHSEAKTKLKNEVKHWLDTLLTRKNMKNVHFNIEEVDNIPIDPKTRKFRLILPPKKHAPKSDVTQNLI